MSSLNKAQFSAIDAEVRDLIAAKSYETLDSGRYMVNVAVSSAFQDCIQGALDKSPKLAEEIIAAKKNYPGNLVLTTITQSESWAHVNTIVIRKSADLSPKEAADLLGKLGNATPLKTVPFLVAPQFDWLVNWAASQSGACDPDIRSDVLTIPVEVADIVNGLFKETEIVVILNFHMGDKPFRVSHACISELKIVDGRLVPNFSE